MKLSIIVPCYNEQETVGLFYSAVRPVLDKTGYDNEILFINDGSEDDTLSEIKNLAEKDDNVKYISFSRNFGKEAAMYAGFCNTDGDLVAVMDADLQDPPELLPEMIRKIEWEGYDSVAARRVSRDGEPPVRSFFAKLFYKIINRISDADIVDGARDFRMMKRDMADAVASMCEINRFSKGIFGWVGFRTYWLSYENVSRTAGSTKWSFFKLFKYGIDGIINFSEVPLSLASWAGFIMTAISFLMLLLIVFRKLLFGDPVAGWASTICIIVFIGGIQLFFMGIMGQYIAKNYAESKHRPHYIIAETNKEQIEKIR